MTGNDDDSKTEPTFIVTFLGAGSQTPTGLPLESSPSPWKLVNFYQLHLTHKELRFKRLNDLLGEGSGGSEELLRTPKYWSWVALGPPGHAHRGGAHLILWTPEGTEEPARTPKPGGQGA